MKYIFLLLISLLFSFDLMAASYKFIEKTGNCYTDIFWKVNSEKYWTTLATKRGPEEYITTNDQQLNALEWRLTNTSNKTNITAKRQKNSIKVTGTFRGKPIERNIRIDKNPWYQPMSFSLSKFIKSKKKVITFWTLNPEDLKPYKMKAFNYGKEIITVNDNEIKTYKVKIILTGLRSFFWHAFYWYRTDDGALIQYKGVDGPPTSPITVINLVEETL
ncbi:MAG: hypothetical protein PHP17_02485 [Candidatus Omnitrophica bacterium]|nr:hypothetical protein [Candidatus Omnitrophota bacterium]